MAADKTQADANKKQPTDSLLESIEAKCREELEEYRTSTRYMRKTPHLVFWLAIWSILSLVVIVGGGANGYLISATAYLLVLLMASVYLCASWQLTKKLAVEAPGESADASALFDYYYALDKRNDKVSNAVHISGVIMGVATIVLVVALIALFALGI